MPKAMLKAPRIKQQCQDADLIEKSANICTWACSKRIKENHIDSAGPTVKREGMIETNRLLKIPVISVITKE